MPCGTFSSGVSEPPSVRVEYTKSYSGTCNNPTETIYSAPGLYGDFEHENGNGQCIEGYHKMLKAGKLIPYTFWQKTTRKGAVSGSADYQWSDGSCTENYLCDDWVLTDPNWWVKTDELWDLTDAREGTYYLQQAAAKLDSTGHDMLTFMAEVGKTRESLRRVIDRLRNTKAYRLKGLSGLTNAWLEWRYSWRPLLGDMENVEEGLANLKDKRKRLTEKAGLTTSWHTDVTTKTGEEDPNANNTITRTRTSYEVGVGGAVAGDLELKSFRFNPVVTAWELVPWSFVLDWIVNVNQAIEAASFALTTDYTACRRHYVRILRTTDYQWEMVAPNWSGTASSMAVSLGELRLRVPCRVSLKPQIKNRIGIQKARDLSLLLRGFFH